MLQEKLKRHHQREESIIELPPEEDKDKNQPGPDNVCSEEDQASKGGEAMANYMLPYVLIDLINGQDKVG